MWRSHALTLDDWLARLQALHPREIELGLTRVSRVAERMQLDLSASRVVIVGGTNGKGSTVAALQAIGLHHGLSVGSYTSPHLLHFNERIRIDGQALDDATLCQLFEEVERARGDVSLTYFEFSTLAALRVFQHHRPHWCILEVGLGGRLDAVNIVDPDVAVVTNIQLDHQDWLGPDRESIAREKAGIFRAGVPALCAERDPPPGLRAAALAVGARWLQAGADFDLALDGVGGWRWHGLDQEGAPLAVSGTQPLRLEPSAVAVALQAAALLLDVPAVAVLARAVAEASLTGRCQTVRCGGREVVLDVAHNPAAAQRLAAYLHSRPVAGRTHVVLAIMADKDAPGFGAVLAPVAEGRWWLPQLDVQRARAPRQLQALLPGVDSLLSGSVADAVAAALGQMNDGDRVVVTGSFYTVAAALRFLAKRGLDGE